MGETPLPNPQHGVATDWRTVQHVQRQCYEPLKLRSHLEDSEVEMRTGHRAYNGVCLRPTREASYGQ